MDTQERDKPSAGAHRFSETVRSRLLADDFAEELRARLLEQKLRATMLGLTADPVKIGRWELRASIDQGAMGAVFRAFDPMLRCEVAIKLLICPGGEDLGERSARMETEARAMAKLKHPNVLRISDFIPASSTADGTPIPSFLVMEFVEGTTLGQWQQADRGDWREVVSKYAQVAAGLAHIHQNDLVHRDIKPANILIRHSGEVLIGDFGLVHGIDQGSDGPDSIAGPEPLTASDRLTQKGAILGTLAYMAPEQLNHGMTSPKSDQFSYFVALYEALYGDLPFKGESRADLLEAMGRDRPSMNRGARDVPRWLRRVVDQGLAMDPDARHASMDAVAQALTAGLQPRSRGWLGAMLGGGALGALTLWLVVGSQDDPCRDAGDLPAWSVPQQAAARFGFMTSGAEGADTAWSRFSEHASHFVRSWQVLKAHTCQERKSAHLEAASELARRRDECADESAYLLSSLMGRFHHASRGDVYYSESAAFELTQALARCEREAVLGGGPPPSVNDSGVANETRVELARSLSAEIAGSLAEAADLAAAALASAKRLRDPALAAQAALRRGRALSLLRKDDEALDLLQEAFTTANSVHRDDIAADALIEQIKVLAIDSGDYRRASVLASLVDSFVARIGGGDPRREAAAAEALGILAEERGARDDAISFHRLALGKRRSQADTPARDLIRSYVNLANALTDPGGDPSSSTEARDLYKQAIDRALGVGEMHPLTANARRAYAAFLDEAGEFEAALREAEASLAVARRVYGDDSAEVAILHVLLGRIALETLSDPELSPDSLIPARAHLEAAMRYFESTARPGVVNPDHISALELSAEVHRLAGETDGAIAAYDRAIEILRPSADHQGGRYADILGYLGELLLDEGRPAEARSRLGEAWEIITLTAASPEESHVRLVAALAVAQAETGDRIGARTTAREAERLAQELDLGGDAGIRARLDPILNDPRITEDDNTSAKE